MPPPNWTANSMNHRYITRANLEELLYRLFPGETDFSITVCIRNNHYLGY